MPFGDGTGPLGRGPGRNCVCPGCGAKIAHQAGTPCGSLNCPKCGNQMVRE